MEQSPSQRGDNCNIFRCPPSFGILAIVWIVTGLKFDVIACSTDLSKTIIPWCRLKATVCPSINTGDSIICFDNCRWSIMFRLCNQKIGGSRMEDFVWKGHEMCVLQYSEIEPILHELYLLLDKIRLSAFSIIQNGQHAHIVTELSWRNVYNNQCPAALFQSIALANSFSRSILHVRYLFISHIQEKSWIV